MEAYSLYEVNQYIKRVIALNFEEAVWVECEINQLSHSRSNIYMDLIEKDESTDEIVAKASATLWYRQQLFIKKKLGKIADQVLSAGIKVKLKVTIEFSERYGLSFNIVDIDPTYTFGQFEMDRQKTIERLQKEKLIEKNRALYLPTVIQNIAIISSETAAGYRDFMEELSHNAYDYAFTTDLYNAAMQGQNTEPEVVKALKQIADKSYDVVIIIRGGGSKLDLSAFDHYNIAEAIAKLSLPVITGIGHEIDQSVSDLVAHTNLKTPTAVASFIIDHNLQFEYEMDQQMMELSDLVIQQLASKKLKLSHLQSNLVSYPKLLISQKMMEIINLQDKSIGNSQQLIKSKKQKLEKIEGVINILNPQNILKRGFTLVKSGNQYVSRKSQLSKKDSDLSIEFYDGDLPINKK